MAITQNTEMRKGQSELLKQPRFQPEIPNRCIRRLPP